MLIAHKPLIDPIITNRMYELYRTVTPLSVNIDTWATKSHTDQFRHWIQSGNCNFVKGLDQYPYSALCSGSSGVIDSFISKNNARRIRFSESEFVLARIIATANDTPWCYLEAEELDCNDAVVISLPFAGNGSIYPDLTNLLDSCTLMNIPVLVDIAYTGISYDIEIDLTSPCISEVACSVSKPFATLLRHGIRFTRNKVDDLLQSSSDLGILSRINVVVASQLMLDFHKDYVINKYYNKQQEICKKLGLTPSNTITLAIGNEIEHGMFKRKHHIRVCITDELML